MSERIRVEITEEIQGMEVTFVGEALSREDAVRAAISALKEYEQIDYEDE